LGSRLQPVLLNQKDVCWLLKPPTKGELRQITRTEQYCLYCCTLDCYRSSVRQKIVCIGEALDQQTDEHSVEVGLEGGRRIGH